jgi:hypothetical protein
VAPPVVLTLKRCKIIGIQFCYHEHIPHQPSSVSASLAVGGPLEYVALPWYLGAFRWLRGVGPGSWSSWLTEASRDLIFVF